MPDLLRDPLLDSEFKQRGYLLLQNKIPSVYSLKDSVWTHEALTFMNKKRNEAEHSLENSGTHRHQYGDHSHDPPWRHMLDGVHSETTQYLKDEIVGEWLEVNIPIEGSHTGVKVMESTSVPEGQLTLSSVQVVHNDERLKPTKKWYYGHSLIANLSDTPVRIWLYEGSHVFTAEEQAARLLDKRMKGVLIEIPPGFMLLFFRSLLHAGWSYALEGGGEPVVKEGKVKADGGKGTNKEAQAVSRTGRASGTQLQEERKLRARQLRMHAYVDMREATTTTTRKRKRTEEAKEKETLPEGKDTHFHMVLDPNGEELRPLELVEALGKKTNGEDFLDAHERREFEKTHTLGLTTQRQRRGELWYHLLCAEGAERRAQAENKAELDRQSKTCAADDCTRVAQFNFEDATKDVRPKYCGDHAQKGMVNVKGTECELLNCKRKQPKFNFAGWKKGRFCGDHKLEGMEEIELDTSKAAWPPAQSNTATGMMPLL